jgi:hypothetical protein
VSTERALSGGCGVKCGTSSPDTPSWALYDWPISAQRKSPPQHAAGSGCPARAFQSVLRSLILEGSAYAESRSLLVPSRDIFTPAFCFEMWALTRDLKVKPMLRFWSTSIYILRSAPRIGRSSDGCTQKGRFRGKTNSADRFLHRDRRGDFGWQFPCQLSTPSAARTAVRLSTSGRANCSKRLISWVPPPGSAGLRPQTRRSCPVRAPPELRGWRGGHKLVLSAKHWRRTAIGRTSYAESSSHHDSTRNHVLWLRETQEISGGQRGKGPRHGNLSQ